MHATLLRPTKAEPSIEKRGSLPALRSLVLNADYRPSTYPLSIIAAARDAVSAIWRERFDVVETWPDAFFRPHRRRFNVVQVCLLSLSSVTGPVGYCVCAFLRLFFITAWRTALLAER